MQLEGNLQSARRGLRGVCVMPQVMGIVQWHCIMSLGWPVGRSQNNKSIEGDTDHCCTNLVERGTQPQPGRGGGAGRA